MSLIFWLVFVGFIDSGAHEAFRLRSGNVESFPLLVVEDGGELKTSTRRLIRRFTEANLVLDYEKSELIYESATRDTRFVTPLEKEPFRGVLCYAVELCQASGWIFDDNAPKRE
ncbi:hypothetical protein [Tabrizicola oligotrophica]|uniref:Uncharacterized protein n=1 Tax=Tabrizicola oligotrophica TaxID=2710650 RepID=A0A6M0QWX6_9RHOB|nr:hypothetical protein [Tabrizicola oligotrophica]NEY91965.1 hypothetical protein [Tabrizicola oligotrophica]